MRNSFILFLFLSLQLQVKAVTTGFNGGSIISMKDDGEYMPITHLSEKKFSNKGSSRTMHSILKYHCIKIDRSLNSNKEQCNKKNSIVDKVRSVLLSFGIVNNFTMGSKGYSDRYDFSSNPKKTYSSLLDYYIDVVSEKNSENPSFFYEKFCKELKENKLGKVLKNKKILLKELEDSGVFEKKIEAKTDPHWAVKNKYSKLAILQHDLFSRKIDRLIFEKADQFTEEDVKSIYDQMWDQIKNHLINGLPKEIKSITGDLYQSISDKNVNISLRKLDGSDGTDVFNLTLDDLEKQEVKKLLNSSFDALPNSTNK